MYDKTKGRWKKERVRAIEKVRERAEAKNGRIGAFLSWSDHLMARCYKDANKVFEEGTQRTSADVETQRMNDIALSLILQHELLLRTGNRNAREEEPDMEHMGVAQFTRDNFSFKGENAYLTFKGKAGQTFKELPIENPFVVSALKRRISEIPDDVGGDDSRLFDFHPDKQIKYFNEISNGWFTPKDLRGLHANRIMLDDINLLKAKGQMPKTINEFQEACKSMVDKASGLLGHANTSITAGHYLASSTMLSLADEIEENDFNDDEDLASAIQKAYYKVIPGMSFLTKRDKEHLKAISNYKQQGSR